MPSTTNIEDDVIDVLNSKRIHLEETVLQYLIAILSEGVINDILEGVPPLLMEACEGNEALAKALCVQMLKQIKLISSETELKDASTPAQLSNPVNIANTKTTMVTGITTTKNAGNTYEVINLGAEPPKDEQEACITLDEFLVLTHSEDAVLRKKALRELCPCHVKHDVERFWQRIIEMTTDPDPVVRYQVLHNLCDGSPKAREDDVIKAIESLHNDEDKYIRRRVHQVLSHYRRTGQWNIL